MVEVHLGVPHGSGTYIATRLSALRKTLQQGWKIAPYCNGLRFAGPKDLVFNQLKELFPGEGREPCAAAISASASNAGEANPALVMLPVGIVHSPFREPVGVDVLRGVDAQIVVDEALLDALQGMVIGDRYLILFCFHRATAYELLQHPRGDTTKPLRGVFALRSPRRPNAIGAAVVELKAVDGNVLTVSGLDALDGSPVLDIKPVLHGTTLP